jgi:plastocyanin
MRVYALLVATSFLIVASVPFLTATSVAQAPIATYSLTVVGETVGGRQVFVPNQILVPQVPIHLVVTFHNNETTPMQHTFTIADENQTVTISTGYVDAGNNVTVNFTVLSLRRILFNGTEFTPEPAAGGGILFYCIPHRGVGMTGQIVASTSASTGTQEKGILVRAYWIGIIGIAATLVWVGISYFVIKTSSRRFTDHREHIRKGLP